MTRADGIPTTLRGRSGAHVPRADVIDDAWSQVWPHVVGGEIAAAGLPFDLLEHEAEALKRELDEKLARKRPCGFTARWDDPGELRRVA